jgi:hypothetical protein
MKLPMMSMRTVSVLSSWGLSLAVIGVGLGSFPALGAAAGGFAFTFGDDLKAASIPSSGFVQGNTEAGDKIVLHTTKKVNKPTDCRTVEFQNIPTTISSPLMGGPRFVEGPVYNNRKSWSNGKEYLSFVDQGTHGTWIVGVEPGVDSGYVYLKPSFPTLVPADATSETVSWHWNLKSKWTELPEMKLTCLDLDTEKTSSSGAFYEVEYWDVASGGMQESILSLANKEYSLLTVSENKWVKVTDLDTICELGGAVSITRRNNGNRNTLSKMARLVNSEHSSNGWRVTLRFAEDFETKQDADASDEALFNIAYDGVIDDYEIKKLSKQEKERSTLNMISEVSNVNTGDFVWIWVEDWKYVPKEGASALTLPPPPTISTVQRTEVLLECISHSQVRNTWSFRFHFTDRRLAMAQTMLSVDTDLYVIAINNSSSAVKVTFEESSNRNYSLAVDMSGLVVIGSDPVSFLRKYIRDKEGVLSPDVSSCYLYHAAVSVPQQFVYALEIVCVLMGAKPATMVSTEILRYTEVKIFLMIFVSDSVHIRFRWSVEIPIGERVIHGNYYGGIRTWKAV